MSKIIMIVLIILLVYFLFFRKESLSNKEESKENKKQEKISEDMVECAKCNLLISPNETILKQGKHFCSKECAYS